VTKSMSKARPAQAGRNSRRSLDAIAADLHRADRQSMFEIGKLLAEARDACEHGDWKKWLEDEEENHFPWGYRTALNYIAAHEFKSKYETVSHLRVPARIIYDLAELAEIDDKKVFKENGDVKGVDDPAMPAIIAALKEAGKKKRLTYLEANIKIRFAVLRHKWGNYPDETLDALDSIPEKAEWAEGAIDALKHAKPKKEDAADSIVNNCHHKHLERIYGGALPTWLSESFLTLDRVEAEHRPEIRRHLNAAKEPLDFNQVMDLVHEVQKGDSQDDRQGDQQGDKRGEQQGDQRGEQQGDQQSTGGKDSKGGRDSKGGKERNDIGAHSKSEVERLLDSNAELARKLTAAEQSKQAAFHKIDELEDQLKAFKGDEPKGGIDRLANALIAALKSTKVSLEKAELTIERICAELKIDPSKLTVSDGKDRVATQSAEPAPIAHVPTEPPLQSSAEAPPSDSNMPTDAIGQWQIKRPMEA
jgi:hypothetical protein